MGNPGYPTKENMSNGVKKARIVKGPDEHSEQSQKSHYHTLPCPNNIQNTQEYCEEETV